jgi:amino acid transporter
MAPSFLAHISPRTHTPQHAVTAYFILVMLLLGMGFDHEFYGCAAGIGVLAMSSVLSVAALRLPARFPELYRSAYITFPKWLLYICVAFTVAFSIGFAVLLLAQRPGVLVLYAACSAPVAIYYKARTRRFTVEDWRRVAAVSLPDDNET